MNTKPLTDADFDNLPNTLVALLEKHAAKIDAFEDHRPYGYRVVLKPGYYLDCGDLRANYFEKTNIRDLAREFKDVIHDPVLSGSFK